LGGWRRAMEWANGSKGDPRDGPARRVPAHQATAANGATGDRKNIGAAVRPCGPEWTTWSISNGRRDPGHEGGRSHDRARSKDSQVSGGCGPNAGDPREGDAIRARVSARRP